MLIFLKKVAYLTRRFIGCKISEKKHRLNVYVRDNLKNLSSRDKSCIRNFF